MRADSSGRGAPLAIACGASVLGTLAAIRYHALGLTLSHYDARGHLVVARRIIDSLTPGWQQIGAVWLPLPHLLTALPSQLDVFYRTGLAGVALSVACFAAASAAIAWLIARATSSWLAACAGVLVFALNPNVLYLQATPMTEPLLIALSVVSIARLVAYCEAQTDAATSTSAVSSASAVSSTSAVSRASELSSRRARSRASGLSSTPGRTTTGGPASAATFFAHVMSPASVGWLFACACLTRYEAWPITIGVLAAAVWALWRRGMRPSDATRAIVRVAIYPLAAIAVFTVFSRIVVGSWFANDFFVPENPAQGHPLESVKLIVWGLNQLSGVGVTTLAGIGLAITAFRALLWRQASMLILPLALLGSAAVPWSAFVDGHPYRIRYMVPLVAVQAVCAGIAAGSFRRLRWAGPAFVVAVTLVELRPFSTEAPMVAEAQWDVPNFAARGRVTACLRNGYAGESVMASMGSLGHYMQDLASAGFSIRDFLHEGNGDIWLNALNTPRPYAGWILIEEKAEGGDMLAKIARERPAFLDGYVRTCEGAGLALYRREPDARVTR